MAEAQTYKIEPSYGSSTDLDVKQHPSMAEAQTTTNE